MAMALRKGNKLLGDFIIKAGKYHVKQWQAWQTCTVSKASLCLL